jgi:hypothetical protein
LRAAAAPEPGCRYGDREGRLQSAKGSIAYRAPQIADRT